MNQKKVLIVEDDRMLSAIFQMFIRDLGHELIGIVSNGDKAIELCTEHNPDIVLMDIHIKGDMDGVATAKILEERFDVPVIYITGDFEEDTVSNSLISNTYGFLVKPLYKSTLGVAIEFALLKYQFDKERIIAIENKP